MTVALEDATREALLEIASNLRPEDREEVFAVLPHDDPVSLAEQTAANGPFQWIATKDGRPVASIGAAPMWPGVWQVWAFGTPEWPRVVLTLTRHVRRFMIPALEQAGAHRAVCFALYTHRKARMWLESLGAEPEMTLDDWGKKREKFVLYSWRRAGH